MISSLLLQQCPQCLAYLTLIVCKMIGKWPYNWCFIKYNFWDLFKTACSILVLFLSKFPVLCNRRDQISLWSLSSQCVHSLPMCMLIPLSVDEILLPRSMNRCTHFRGLQFNEKMAPSRSKYASIFFNQP